MQNDIRVLRNTLRLLQSKETDESIKNQSEEEYLALLLNDLIRKYKYRHKQLRVLKENGKQIVKNFHFEHLHMYLKQLSLHFIDDDYVGHIPCKEVTLFTRNVNADTKSVTANELRYVLLEMLSLLEVNMNRLYISVNQYKYNAKYCALYKAVQNDVCLRRRKSQIRNQHEVHDIKKKEMIEKVYGHKDKLYVKRVKKGNDGININYKIQQLNNNNKHNYAHTHHTNKNKHPCNDANDIEMLIKYDI